MKAIIAFTVLVASAFTANAQDYSKNSAASTCLVLGVEISPIDEPIPVNDGAIEITATNRTNLTLSTLVLEVTFDNAEDLRDGIPVIWELPSLLGPGQSMSGRIDAPAGASHTVGRIGVGNALDQHKHRIVEREAFYGSMPVYFPDVPASQTICEMSTK